MERFDKILNSIEGVSKELLEFTAKEQEVLEEFIGSWFTREQAERMLEEVLIQQGKDDAKN